MHLLSQLYHQLESEIPKLAKCRLKTRFAAPIDPRIDLGKRVSPFNQQQSHGKINSQVDFFHLGNEILNIRFCYSKNNSQPQKLKLLFQALLITAGKCF